MDSEFDIENNTQNHSTPNPKSSYKFYSPLTNLARRMDEEIDEQEYELVYKDFV